MFAVFDSLSGDSVTISRLVRVRWHPYIPNLLVILTSDGKLLFSRCVHLSGASLRFDKELTVNLLDSSDHMDKENDCYKTCRGLNLSEAMGAVCRDFDFGSPLFDENGLSRDTILRVPIYVICENGNHKMFSSILLCS